MVVWLTHKLRSTFEIEPSKPYFILISLLLSRTQLALLRQIPVAGTLKVSPSTQFFSPLPLLFQNSGLIVASPPIRKGGGGGVILYYLSPLLNIGYARHVDKIISNQWQNTKMAGQLLVGSVITILKLVSW